MFKPLRDLIPVFAVTLATLVFAAFLFACGGAAQQHPNLIPRSCADRELKVLALIDDHGTLDDVMPAQLTEAFLALLDARAACYAGKTDRSLMAYDKIIQTLGPLHIGRKEDRCGWRAQVMFQDLEKELKVDSYFRETVESVSRYYRSYYNEKINRCLVLIDTTETTANKTSHTSYIEDADERLAYAFYVDIGSDVVVCELMPSFAGKTLCQSHEDFSAFVARYMNE